jgi:hypothetical protein
MSIWVALTSLVLGTALAATCGVRTFLPLFALGLAARLGVVELGEAFAWLMGAPALLALGSGVVLELVSDKVPWLASILDALKAPARAAAGMVAVAATMVDLPVWVVAIVALIVGGGVALGVHVARSGFRLAAAAKSGGALNPVLSVVEDVVVAAVIALSFAFVSVAAVVAGLGLFVLWQAWRAVRARRRRRP